MNTLLQRNAIVQHVLSSPHSSFYRQFYARRNIECPGSVTQEAQWESLPLLTKDDLIRAPFRERLYVPFENAGSVRLTSGTSNRGILLFPRNEQSYRPDMAGTCTRMLMMYYPLSPLDDWGRAIGINGITGVPGNIAATARMAELFQIDGIAGPVNGIIALLHALEARYDTARIRYVLLQGGFASPAQFAEIHEMCPHARCTWEYSSIEGNGKLGRPCPEHELEKSNHIHFEHERCYAEIVDPETGMVIHDNDVEGELVITTAWTTNALPVIRYRTADMAIRRKRTCSCLPGTDLFQVLGRAQFDRANIPGGQLQSRELERVLFPFRHMIHSDFEMHVFEEKDLLVRLILNVRPRTSHFDAHLIVKALEESMRVSPVRTLGACINEGLIDSLVCNTISEPPDAGRRPTRIRIITSQ